LISAIKYKQPDFVIGLTAVIAVLLSYILVWKNNAATPVNFIDGDAEYYYYYLQSSFIDAKLFAYEWLTPGSGSYITHHPVGVSLLLMPFFLVAFVAAKLFAYPLDGLSAPFQLAISATAIFYCTLGLVYLKKLFRLNGIPDKITALTITLVFFGTTLYHYTLIESGMSHTYSFCFITVFLYHSCKFIQQEKNKHLFFAAFAFSFILLLRPNNGLIIFSVFFWFKSREHCINFFKNLLKNKAFYYALLIPIACVLFQLLTWAVKENNLFTDRYAPYGFYWLHPQFIKMLFGFDSGFFIYTPLCFLFMFGLIPVYKENKFLFCAIALFLLGIFYFFSCYSAYTYFDGLGLRVLVDYYAVFALLGAKLFARLYISRLAFTLTLLPALFFALVSVVYSYQASHNILKRSGMTYNQWKYIFFKTGSAYRDCLGGSNDLTPFSKQHPAAILSDSVKFEQPFNFSQKEFGVVLTFDSLRFNSKRILLKLNCARKELFTNASKNALICVSLQNRGTHKSKSYFQFRLNETPAKDCCDEKQYHYASVMSIDIEAGDRLAVYLWNMDKQPFLVSKFSASIYNYNYQIN
jgi:hypothetical protein